MISLLGRTAVLIALAAGTVGACTGIAAGMNGSKSAAKWARAMAVAYALAMIAAVGLMEYALLTHDFSVSYVAQVGSTKSPVWVSIVSLWSSLEGSILLWGLIQGVYLGAFALKIGDRFGKNGAWALAVIHVVSVFFAFLIAGVANPFVPVDPAPMDGPGPNPLLQNHILMVIHPPFLYFGFVGMAVPFGIACAALLAGKMEKRWAKLLRNWTILPWGALTIGIILGGWWSYEVLGWGGYWAWDPVENASFLPWLTATAYLHSSLVTERRDHLKVWTITLVMASFLLTILGTFMTRSGVFNSVHSFTQSDIGPVFLVFLAICLVFSIVLLAARMDMLQPPKEEFGGAVSRESAFLFNNILFCAMTFTVLLGTLYPLINEALTEERISVGEPYFNAMAVPVALVIVFLMGVGPALPWGRWTPAEALQRVGPAGLAGLIAGAATYALWPGSIYVHGCFAACAFAMVTTLREMIDPARARANKTGESAMTAFSAVFVRARRRYGGYVVHIGVILIAVGIAASSGYRKQKDVTLAKDQAVEIQGYTLTYLGHETKIEPHRHGMMARVEASKDGKVIGVLEPALNQYLKMNQAIGTPAVKTTLVEDLYLSLLQVDEDADTASLMVLVEPMVWWIWFGGGVMVLGTLISAWPRRTRQRAAQPAAAAAEASK